MTETQIEFFQRLCAPFEPHELARLPYNDEQGRPLIYVKPRRLHNRLDDVAGVDGWRPQYRRTIAGFTCRLWIRIPSSDDNEPWLWFWKEDGAGVEGMMKKRKGEEVHDSDNDEKSGYTNSFRRACVAWGMARYLYRDGVPEYLGYEPEIPELPLRGAPTYKAQAKPQRREPWQPRTDGGAGYQSQSPPQGQGKPQGQPQGQGDRNPFNVPQSGKGLYAWAKGLETHFQVAIVNPLNDMLKQSGRDMRMVDLDRDQAQDLALRMIADIKEWQNYNGEFDHINTEHTANP